MENLFFISTRQLLEYARRAALLLGLSGLASGAFGQTFAPFNAYSTGTANNPQSIALGDVNGDGRPDIVTSNASLNTVGVLIGQAGGTFAPVVAYFTGATNGVRSVALGDVNGDGRLDIVAAIYSAGTVSVLLGQAGGTFAPAVSYSPPGTGPFFVTLEREDNYLCFGNRL